jgi:dolichyl-phosphate-mannose--protein O-mannosyl transferase
MLVSVEALMDEEERKWKQWEEFVKQAEEEQAKNQDDFFLLRIFGCFVGGMLSPLVMKMMSRLARRKQE